MKVHPDGVLLAMDEMRLYFKATRTHVWAPIGQTPIIKVHPQRDSCSFYGALDLRTGRDIASRAPVQNSEITANFLMQLLMLYPDRPILLLMDRASWHYGEVRQLIESACRLEVMYFPTACPDLNPQEHTWAQARDAISHNHGYTNFETLLDDFEAFLNETPFQTNFMQKYASCVT
ncbi:MAG: IS630 family transposase [Chloroflexota bacterium]